VSGRLPTGPPGARSWNTPFGRLALRGAAELLDELHRQTLQAAAARHHTGQFVDLHGTTPPLKIFLKGTYLRGKAIYRHTLRTALGCPLPCEREFRNLTWLRTHGFLAPRPLAAGGIWRGLVPCYQVLITELVADASTLCEVHPSPEQWHALGTEVARLHNSGFIHRDLFPRNVLLNREGKFVFLDTRYGGRSRPFRDAAYDLACLTLDPAPLGPKGGDALFAGYSELRRLPRRYRGLAPCVKS